MLSTDTVTHGPGRTGAKRQSYAGDNPREVLARVAARNNDEDKVRDKVWEVIEQHPLMQRTIFEYWFANNYKSLAVPKPPRRSASQIAAATAVVRRKVEQAIEREVNIRLLDMLMPSGKSLSASSREELISVGGWAMRVADRLKPGQTVVEAGLTEDDLRNLYQSG